jgi:mannose-6-phosphate isomerase-like protein (cupin superfamily)
MTTAVHGFPAFMKNPANRIAQSNQATPGVEGYVFDGSDGSQMAFWTCSEDALSGQHVHDYDEYMVVVEGCYTLIINGDRIPVNAGKEYFIPRGLAHSGRFWLEQERSTHSAAIGLTAWNLVDIRATSHRIQAARILSLRHHPPPPHQSDLNTRG